MFSSYHIVRRRNPYPRRYIILAVQYHLREVLRQEYQFSRLHERVLNDVPMLGEDDKADKEEADKDEEMELSWL